MTPGTLDSDEVPRQTSRRPGKARLATTLTLAAVALGGCATAQRPDPLEPMNRKVFAFNEGLDKALVKPVATAYKTVLPDVVRTGATNFFSNLSDPWSAVNLLLQGRIKDGLSDLGRFGTNTVVGVLGFVDDPYSTYLRGVPYLWAFDGAFYISPSYDERTLMPEALESWGCNRHYWYPIALKADKAEPTAEFFNDRSVDRIKPRFPTPLSEARHHLWADGNDGRCAIKGSFERPAGRFDGKHG